MEDRVLITVVTIICITILEAIALAKGIDGAMLASVFAILGAIAGWKGGVITERKRYYRRTYAQSHAYHAAEAPSQARDQDSA